MKKFLTTLLVVFIYTIRINAYVPEDQPTIKETRESVCTEFFTVIDAFVLMAMQSGKDSEHFFLLNDTRNVLEYLDEIDKEYKCYDGELQ